MQHAKTETAEKTGRVLDRDDREEDRAEVSEVPAVSGGDSVVAPVLVPVLASYRTDSMENKVAGMALAEVLEASAEVPAYAYDRRRYPA